MTIGRATVLGCLLVLASCTTATDRHKVELATLAVQLPGNYDNQRQVLTILRIAAPLVGDHVFYVRETAADDLRRVFSEHIWSLDVAPDTRIVAAIYALDEPERWRGGADSPELFRSLLLRDLRSLPGCELVWQKSPQGYTAASASPRCPQSWRLEGEALSFSEHAGAAAAGTDPYFHFVRRAGGQP